MVAHAWKEYGNSSQNRILVCTVNFYTEWINFSNLVFNNEFRLIISSAHLLHNYLTSKIYSLL